MKTLFLVFLLWSWFAAKGQYQDVQLVRIYDGDNITVDLPCEDPLVCDAIPIRIKGIDAPEILGHCAKERALAKVARDYLRSFCVQKIISLSDCERGKYFRLACRVAANNVDISSHMIKKRLARQYKGKGKRKSWCP